MHIKSMIIGALAALITAVFLQLLLPAILGFLFAITLSGATLLDPLYADDRLNSVWGVFRQMVALQTAQTLITAVFAGAVVGEIAVRWQSCWGNIIAGTISAIIHVLFLFIFAAILPLFIGASTNGLARTYALFMALTMGFLIGVISAGAARKWG